MSSKVLQEIPALLVKIAHMLTPAAHAVWMIYMRQVVILGIENTLWTLLCFSVVVFCAYALIVKKSPVWEGDATWGSPDIGMVWVLAGVVALCFFIACLGNVLNDFGNPALVAIRLIISGASNGTG